MLGSLARWLRVLGFDVAYDTALDDAELVALAVHDGRTILTRDRRLVQRRLAKDHILIDSDDLDRQLLQVVTQAGLAVDPRSTFGRCLDCNGPLEPIPAAAARPWVPPYVARTQERFHRCPSCERIFWRATHVVEMERRLRRLGLWPD